MSISERLNTVISSLKLSKRQFAISLGYSPESIYLVLREKEPLNDKILMRISQNYPHINTNWITSGEGEMLLPGEATNQPNQTDMITEDRIKAIEDDVRLIKKMLTKLLDQADEQEKKSTG